MDLVTLVAGCALAVDPKIMHALIWHQSGGEPWSFSMPGERQPQVYQTVRDAIGAVGVIDRDDIAIRVGLTGLSANPRSATAVIFAPCPNITFAARQIAQLASAARPLHTSRPIRFIVPSPPIVARGTDLTTASRMQSGQL